MLERRQKGPSGELIVSGIFWKLNLRTKAPGWGATRLAVLTRGLSPPKATKLSQRSIKPLLLWQNLSWHNLSFTSILYLPPCFTSPPTLFVYLSESVSCVIDYRMSSTNKQDSSQRSKLDRNLQKHQVSSSTHGTRWLIQTKNKTCQCIVTSALHKIWNKNKLSSKFQFWILVIHWEANILLKHQLLESICQVLLK